MGAVSLGLAENTESILLTYSNSLWTFDYGALITLATAYSRLS